MKGLVLCACVSILASSSSTELKQQLISGIENSEKIGHIESHEIEHDRNIQNDIKTCGTENNITRDEYISSEEIITNVTINEERKRKFGCYGMCILRKQSLRSSNEGIDIKEAEIDVLLRGIFGYTGREQKPREIARKCIEEVKDIMEECEKGFSLYACLIRDMHKARKEEHEREETEKEAETEQAE